MALEQLMSGTGPRYVQMQLEPSASVSSSFFMPRQDPADLARIFDELPEATIVSVSRPDASDISPMLLSYTIEFQYKQVRVISLSLNASKLLNYQSLDPTSVDFEIPALKLFVCS